MNQPMTEETTKMRVKFMRTGIVVVLALSAWTGVLICGMSRPWAMTVSLIGGLLAMFAGMVIVGVKYHQDFQKLSGLSDEAIESLRGELDVLRKEVARQKREFGIAAVAMTKNVADRVAAKLMARYSKTLPSSEHVESAMREANEIVAGEIVAYGESILRQSKG